MNYPSKRRPAYRIDQRLRERGLSREWLAARLGVSVQTLGSYIRGQQLPPEWRLRQLCTYLECDENFIFFGRTCDFTKGQGGVTRPLSLRVVK